MAISERIEGQGFKSLLSYLIYPFVLFWGIWMHYLLRPVMPLFWSTQLPLIAGMLVISGLEFYLPYQRHWLPRRREFGEDLVFMLLVQVLVPKALTLLFALSLLKWSSQAGWGLHGLWPHHWPEGAQMILMLVLGDFGRYWLHRWFHTVPALWRFHAVHHSPQILYWNNVNRFHPIDKGIQFLFDTLPFMLLGVKPEVFSLYFVFYALTGFFQHCNIDVRLGWLNHVISGPELHRWHHSRLIEESNMNYGNKVIFFDTLFGTRLMPRDRIVSELGLYNRRYPSGFRAQLKMPFIAGADKQDLPDQSWKDILINHLLQLRMFMIRRKLYQPLRRAAQAPRATQEALLLEIVRRNQDTDFGKAHHFDVINSIEEYQRLVPLQDFESLQPLIDRQARTGQPALTAETPVMYNQTSGTTGQPKYIPILERTLKDLKQSQNLYSEIAYRAQPGAFAGKLVGIVSPAVEGQLPSGQPYGSASGHIYQNMPAMARAKYVLPSELFAVSDYDIKYYLILRLTLAERGVSYMGSANPSTFKKLLDLLDSEGANLIDEIETGACRYLESLSESLQKTLRRQLRPAPQRAAELRALFARKPRPDLCELWPGLRLLSTWTGGSCRIALEAIQDRIPEQVRVMELGYLSSEFRGTITIDAVSGQGLPTLQTHFFEFVEAEQWESGTPVFLTLERLEPERQYYLFITTAAGLYRYQMNDIVKVTGRFENTPTLSFVQKGKGVTNITGEKLYENQIIQAVSRSEQELGTRSAYYMALADETESLYRLYIEFTQDAPVEMNRFAARVESHLFETNVEYQAKRGSGRLRALDVRVLQQGTYEAFKRYCVNQGQREGQFKIVALQYQKDFAFDLNPYTLKTPTEIHKTHDTH